LGAALVSLRDRIAAALDKALPESATDVGFYQRLGVTPLVDIEAYDLNLESLADAVIAELDLGIPCAANGCKVRRIARYHAEKSSQLSPEADDGTA
jgi:hypothetical protein